MTRRARLLLDALEDGCATRHEIHAHAGCFFLTNNAASDLRRAGIAVVWDRDTDEYRLLDEPGLADGAGIPSPDEVPGAGLVEQADGQYAMDVAA